MTTKKFQAYARLPATRYQNFPLVDACGNQYSPIRSYTDVSVGDKVFLGCRINNHHGERALWELWPIVVEEAQYGKFRLAKVNYSGGRYLFIKTKSVDKS